MKQCCIKIKGNNDDQKQIIAERFRTIGLYKTTVPQKGLLCKRICTINMQGFLIKLIVSLKSHREDENIIKLNPLAPP